jgi:hypothetical protein
MMMDTTVDTDGTAFICPECSFNGKSLPELISHLNEAHSEGLFIAGRYINHLFFSIQKLPIKVKHDQKMFHQQHNLKNDPDVNQLLVIK